ncbi:Laminin subunit beta-4 [Bienertia sinuspersici]
MEILQRAKVFRLKCSHHSKYLTADEDEERIKQDRDKSSNRARWYYELVEGKTNVIRLRNCWSYRYLSASENPFLLGMTGKKVVQTIIQGSALEWEPVKEGPYIKLKSHTGTYLRANPKVPPWRNSVTHVESDHWTATDNMILWIIDIVEIDYQSTKSMEEVKEHNESMHSDSFNKLKSALASLDDDRDGADSERTSSATSDEHIHPIEVTMAKQTLKELEDMDFHTIQSSGRGEKFEKALKVLIADSKMPSQDLLDLQEKLKKMKNEHASASQELVEYSNFSTTRLKITSELKKDAAKARELETFQAELHSKRTKREDLLKQLEEIDTIIKDVEKAQADNLADVEELISGMGQKSQKLEEMKHEEEAWQVRITEAYRMLERSEEEWEMVKTMFPDER